MANAIVWFDIFVKDLDRAIKFYNTVLGVQMQKLTMEDGTDIALFPTEPDEVGGDLVVDKNNPPSDKGHMVYLNGGDDLAVPLSRVVGAGGEVLQDKFSLGEHGNIAYFKDTEGNKVAFHSPN